MAAAKKVVVRLADGATRWGYTENSGFVRDATLDLLDFEGRHAPIGLGDVKFVAFVRDFNLDDTVDPERLGRASFAGRPRGEGLWLRLKFRDGQTLEMLSPFDLKAVQALAEDGGLTGTPADGRSNTLRLYVPRTALASVELLGAVLSPTLRAAAKRPRSEADAQPGLFPDSE